jgi:hypothetical protein
MYLNGSATPSTLVFERTVFRNFDFAGHHLTAWAANATVASGCPPVMYRVGDVVTHGPLPTLYRATAASTGTGTAPSSAPAAWSPIARPTDDARVRPGKRYAEQGVRQSPDRNFLSDLGHHSSLVLSESARSSTR